LLDDDDDGNDVLICQLDECPSNDTFCDLRCDDGRGGGGGGGKADVGSVLDAFQVVGDSLFEVDLH
jgi:hypothetical protein